MLNETTNLNSLVKFLAWKRLNLFFNGERNRSNELCFFCFQIVRRHEAVTERKAKPRKVTLLSLYLSYRSSDQRWLKNYSTMHGTRFADIYDVRKNFKTQQERDILIDSNLISASIYVTYIHHSHAALTHFRLLWSNIPPFPYSPSFIRRLVSVMR